MGIIDRVVPDTLQDEALAQAKAFAAGPTKHLARPSDCCKSPNAHLETQMERETQTIVDLARSADAREGIDAFVHKRKPNFKGC